MEKLLGVEINSITLTGCSRSEMSSVIYRYDLCNQALQAFMAQEISFEEYLDILETAEVNIDDYLEVTEQNLQVAKLID